MRAPLLGLLKCAVVRRSCWLGLSLLLLPACGSAATDGSETATDTTGTNAYQPLDDVEPDGPKVTGVATGTRNTCALFDNGGVKCWGSGHAGALGYGNETDIGHYVSPAEVGFLELGGAAVDVGVGFLHACALLDDASVVCWGANTGGLGYGHRDNIGDDELPADAGPVDVGGDVIQLSVGSYVVCVLLTSNEVKCWGSNGHGLLGQGNDEWIGDDEVPATIDPISLGGDVREVRVGFAHACAMMATGELRCWGDGDEGRTGQGNTDPIGDDELPSSAPAVDLGEQPITSFSVGSSHSCVVHEDQTITCFGYGGWGALGHGNTESIGDDELPSEAGAVPLPGPATAVYVGSHNTCAVLGSGELVCWGLGELGANGNASTEMLGDDELPASLGAVEIGSALLDISGGGAEHFCAPTLLGNLRCWGENGYGQLGYPGLGRIGDDETPASAGVVPLL